jgi:hypothetical protein
MGCVHEDLDGAFAPPDARSYMLSGSRANLMTGKIAHVLETFDTLEVGRSGYERVLNVVTDLPISAGTPGFDAEKLHALAQEHRPTSAFLRLSQVAHRPGDRSAP